MYQAIVFLPLLGAVLAGIIALAGAHARHPGGPPPQGAEDHIVDLPPPYPPPQAGEGREGAVAPSARVGAAVIHVSHAEPEQHEPAAAGSRTAELITTTLLFVSMVL